MLNLHDIPGEHTVMVRLPAYGTANHGAADIVFVAPFDCKLVAGSVYFQGTASVGQANNYFTLTTTAGTTAIGTASLNAAKAFKTGVALFSGTTSLSAGDKVYVSYGTVGTGLAAPASFVVLKFKGA